MKGLLLLLLIVVLGALSWGAYRTLTPPSDLYANSGQFGGCPKRPSCVSSMATDDTHRVAAIGYTGDFAANFVMLQEVVERMGGEIEHQREGYIHAVFITPDLKLRDDLELLMLPTGRVDVRSISRFAYDDSGVNRARVEQLRQAFEAIP